MTTATRDDEALSDREYELLLLIAQDLHPEAISAAMHISRSTVKTYRNRMHKKLGVTSDMGAVVKAFRQGLIS
jgi:DNA-binding CsgD family transcriptional regulator